MTQYLVPLAKRLAVLVPGVFIAWLSVSNIFPYIDRRLPYGISVLLTYMLGAYLLVPALIRLARIIRPPKHLPLYCVTPDGFASDPLNIGIMGTRSELINAMKKAGWYEADPHSLKNTVRQILAFIFEWPYKRAPVSSLYLFGRKHDLAFEIPLGDIPGGRHHVRFWATTYQNKKRLTVRSIHWHHRRSRVLGDNLLWVGAASQDVGLALIRHNFQVTHMVHPDTNQERELIVSQLQAAKLVKKTEDLKLGDPYRLVNRVVRGYLHSDGIMTVVRLKAPGG